MPNFSAVTAQDIPEEARRAADEFVARKHGLFIDGRWRSAGSGATLAVTDPATGQRITEVADADADDVDAAVRAARKAFDNPEWRDMNPHERGALLNRIAGAIEANADELALIQAHDLGTVMGLSTALVQGGADAFRYYAGWPTKIFGRTFPSDGSSLTISLREPLGVIGAIIPWNGPAQAMAWKIAPALACGNTVVFKAAADAPLVCVRIMELMVEAGLPAGVVNLITDAEAVAGKALVDHPLVDKITFTGSTEVGKSIMAAGAATLKKVTLELGGKSPTIIFADADLDKAIPAAVVGFTGGAGQGCVAGSRMLVQDSIYDEVVARIAESSRHLKVGSGFDPDTQVPPIVSRKQLDTIMGYIAKGSAEGARLVTGGKAREGDGFFVEPTVFAEVTADMAIFQEEIFGPVGAIVRFSDEADAVRLANDTSYGLSASVWTRDASRLHRMVRALQAGTVWANTIFELDPIAPFGGYKQSGLGRELGPDSIEAYTQVKTGVIRF